MKAFYLKVLILEDIRMKDLFVTLMTASILFLSDTSYSQGSWQFQISGTNAALTDVLFINPSTGWAVGWDGIVLRTTNSGNNWQSTSLGNGIYLSCVFFLSSYTGWIAGSGGLWKSTDSGVSWLPVTCDGLLTAYSVHFFNGETGWVSGVNQSYYTAVAKTTNGGMNWSYQILATMILSSDIQFIGLSQGRIAAGNGVGGYFFRTSNGGDSWTEIDPGCASLNSMYFADENTGWVAGDRGTLMKTEDGGNNWVEQHNVAFYEPAFMGIHFTSVLTGWCVGTSGAIMRTTNGGFPWIMWGRLTTENLFTPRFISSNTGWVVGMNGTILRYTDQLNQPVYLDLKVLPQGMSNSVWGTTVRDSVKVETRTASPPHGILESVKGFFETDGSVILTLSNCSYNVPYYLVVDHRNTIETWSAYPVVFTANSLPYHFTWSDLMAYGQNQVAIGPWWYALYSGDVNKDGIIDISDLVLIDNDAHSSATGYLATDVTGNNVVDLSDLTVTDNNVRGFVSIARP